jgi:hypothetical protein
MFKRPAAWEQNSNLCCPRWVSEAICAGRNQSRLGDLLDYVDFGSPETGASGFPAFHIVIGQNFGIGPSRLTVEMGLRWLLSIQKGCVEKRGNNNYKLFAH